MLVLHRKENQAIVVDGPATIVVLRIDGSGVRLGIKAEQSTTILREELLDREPRGERNVKPC